MMAGPSMRARMRTAPAAGRPGLDVDPEDPLEALRPGHRGTAFGRCSAPPNPLSWHAGHPCLPCLVLRYYGITVTPYQLHQMWVLR